MRALIFTLALLFFLPPSAASSATKRRLACEKGEVMVGVTKGKKVLCKSIFEVLQEAIEKEAQGEHTALAQPMRNWVFRYKRKAHAPSLNTSSPSNLQTPKCVLKTRSLKKGIGTFDIDRGKCPNMFSSLKSLGSQARIIPNYQKGVVQGYKFVGVRPNSVWRTIGIKSGDVLVELNGRKTTSPHHALDILDELKTAKTLTLEILRRTQRIELKYTLVGPSVP